LIAFGLVRAHTSLLKGQVFSTAIYDSPFTQKICRWQFLFLVCFSFRLCPDVDCPVQIEAIPTIVMGTVILFFLPPFPFSASFLTPRERAIAQARLNRDHKPQSHGGMTGWQGFKAIVADPNAWLFMAIYASCECLLSLL